MDAEKVELSCCLWESAKTFHRALETLANDSGDGQALEAAARSLQPLRPYLSSELSERILYLFSGAEIEPEDLRNAGLRLLLESSEAICKALIETLSACDYIEQPEAEKLFRLLDEIPRSNIHAYQMIFDCCLKAAVAAPMQAFQQLLRMLEEQPGLLSNKKMAHPGYTYRPSEQHTFERCPICGGAGTPYYSAFAYKMEDFSYPHLPVKLWMKCGSCGNLYTWKYPKELLTCSEPERLIMPDPSQKLTAVTATDGSILSIWSRILNKLRTYTDGTELLEVGIGQGELLAVALEMGYQADAVEIVPEAAHKAADMLGIPVWCGDFLNYAPGKNYSMITMGDVIEHVADPEKALRNAYGLLRENGVLWLSTPNFESSFSRMRKFRDPMWLEPYHITYFNRAGLETLAAKCGFTLQEYSVSQRYNGSMELILRKGAKEGRDTRI